MSQNIFNVENEEVVDCGCSVEFDGTSECGKDAEKELPAQVSVWSKMRDFLLQDASQITIELQLTPGEQKFVDFWTQEITADKAYDFLFQEVKLK